MPPTDEAVLLNVIRWARANGWKLTDRTESFEARLVSYTWGHALVPQVKVCLAGDDDITIGWKQSTAVVGSLAAAVNQLACLELIPPEMAPLYRDGFAAGADSVTVTAVLEMLDLEIDKLAEAQAKNDLADRLADLLPPDPFDARQALDRIVDAVVAVLHD